MPWTKLDDQLPFNTKMRGLSHGAFRLAIVSWTYSNYLGSDGFIPADDLDDLRIMAKARGQQQEFMEELLSSGCWHPADQICKQCLEEYANPERTIQRPLANGYVIHDWLAFNRTAAEVAAERAAARLRQARRRKRHGVTNGVSHGAPDPDPDPVPRMPGKPDPLVARNGARRQSDSLLSSEDRERLPV